MPIDQITQNDPNARPKMNAAIDEANKVPFKAEQVDLLIVANTKADKTTLDADIAKRLELVAQVGTIETGLAAEVLAREALAAEVATFTYGDSGRPGDRREFFTSSLEGSAQTATAIADGEVAVGEDGHVLRVRDFSPGPLVVAARAEQAVEPGQVYAARWAVRRAHDTSDPLGDAVGFGLAFLSASKGVLSEQLVANTALAEADGRIAVQATYTRDMVADIVVPAAARYVRPFVRIHGGDGTTDVEVIAQWETRNLPGPKGDTGDITPALQTLRDEAVTAATVASEAAAAFFDTFADLTNASVPAGTEFVILRGRLQKGDGGGFSLRAVETGTDDLFATTSLDGQRWRSVESVHTSRMAGIDLDGVIDCTDTLRQMFEYGGNVRLSDGIHFVAEAGPDAGGVEATITRSLHVMVEPGAVLKAGANLDNDLVRLVVPSDGAGITEQSIDITFEGVRFDQSEQRNTAIVPQFDVFPPPNPGASGTADGLSIRGNYLDDIVSKNAFRSVVVRGNTFYQGDHWQTAGGDSGLFVGSGAKRTIVQDNTFQGARDLGCYASADLVGDDDDGEVIMRDNTAINCFFGFGAKRGANNFKMTGNHCINCVAAYSVNLITNQTIAGSIAHNTAEGCKQLVRIDGTRGVEVVHNTLINAGALDGAGGAIAPYPAAGIWLQGSVDCTIAYNKLIGVRAEYLAAFYELFRLDAISGGGNSERNYIAFNRGFDGVYGVGTETASEADNNSFDRNSVRDGTLASVVVTGPNSYEIRSTANGLFSPEFQYLSALDGSQAEPSIFRRGDRDSGVYWTAGGTFNVSVAGVNRLTLSEFVGLSVAAGLRVRTLGPGTPIIFENLPGVDPGVAGQLWRDGANGNVLKVSTG